MALGARRFGANGMFKMARRRHLGAWLDGRGFLSRLAEDTRGNVLIIVGASILPLLALIGSGIDMSRGYMAQARLQVACDAAALAGRRAMTNGNVDSVVRAEVTKFFNFNFPQGSFGTASFSPVITEGANSTVIVNASTSIPTAIMNIFGFTTLPLNASCNAKQDFVNTDIVLVLDTTGSMDQTVGGTRKIESLRAAVLALYDELKPVQDQLEAAGLRLRYGVVPYASSVNVGAAVMSANAGYIVSDNWTYQSREPRYQHVEANVTKAYCDGKNGSWNPNSWGSTVGSCTTYDNVAAGGTLNGWIYRPMTHNVANYVAGNAVPTPTRTPGTSDTSTWAGCIEERQTVNTITSSSGYTIPVAARDLDIDLIPTDNTTRWAPYWPEVEYLPSNIYQFGGENNKPQWACPTAARRLQAWTRTAMSDYLDLLQPDGGTYHDNGMIWGARFISPTGIFSANNPTTFGNMPVARYIIFMTDGLLDTGYQTLYTTYGVERWDQRVGGTDDPTQESRHRQRFKMMCNATKGMNVSIWVVAFASSLDADLTECASKPSQASTSADQAQLMAKFVEIGKNIGSLRLTQ